MAGDVFELVFVCLEISVLMNTMRRCTERTP